MHQPHIIASASLSLDLLVAAATLHAAAPVAESGFNFKQQASAHPMSISNLAFDYQDTSDTTPNDPAMPPRTEEPASPAWPNSLKHKLLPTLISPPITPMFSNTSIAKSLLQCSFPTTSDSSSSSSSPTNTAFEDTLPLYTSSHLPAAARKHEMQARPYRRCAPSFQETTPPATSARELSDKEDAVRRSVAAKYICRFCPKSFKRKHHVESHEVTHSTNYDFVCKLPGCTSKFRRNQDLLRHWRNVKH
ncbi:hypothetical protein CcCBS67573_g03498 [Chytriomyces confervae]|uniref:C2H2-type domain-containing protein n=1 Tax=Chytriomyces confervae TaxID=246404 RepID=A0A507FGF1_9FUNG|nr:hypothetical protein HDU80_002934 [Chytriomyces hyalinus]TPX75222.1 hypothetical protein CcCBS67573_g03498 [Chytriomyces confervae]